MNGWRTVVLQEKTELTVKNNQLISTGKQEIRIPLEQLKQIMIQGQGSVMTAASMVAAAKEHVHIIVCGEKYTPVCEMVPIGQHYEASGAVMDQAKWRTERKDLIWKEIVELKLRNQLALLKEVHRDPPPRFREYMDSVEPGDKTNREALAARMYFSSLFGRGFRRHGKDDLNSKLNYGYTILCSAVSRILAMHGYHTGLGIHHCSRDNPVNLSCDLMEPFRPFVDKLVFESEDGQITWEMRKKLIALTEQECRLDGKSMTLEYALEMFCIDTLKAVRDGRDYLMEVSFG